MIQKKLTSPLKKILQLTKHLLKLREHCQIWRKKLAISLHLHFRDNLVFHVSQKKLWLKLRPMNNGKESYCHSDSFTEQPGSEEKAPSSILVPHLLLPVCYLSFLHPSFFHGKQRVCTNPGLSGWYWRVLLGRKAGMCLQRDGRIISDDSLLRF